MIDFLFTIEWFRKCLFIFIIPIFSDAIIMYFNQAELQNFEQLKLKSYQKAHQGRETQNYIYSYDENKVRRIIFSKYLRIQLDAVFFSADKWYVRISTIIWERVMIHNLWGLGPTSA